jgi:hypothetical protein
MIWGQARAVPAVGFWGAVVLCAVLMVVGLRLLRSRRRAIGVAVLLLALAAPLTAKALSLPFTFANNTVADATQVNANFAALAATRAYGFVRANATLDPLNNVGIVDVVQPAGFTGYYCFKLGFSPKNAVATIDPTTTGTVDIIMTTVPRSDSAGLSGCPSDHLDGGVVIKNMNGALANAGFYIAFQ